MSGMIIVPWDDSDPHQVRTLQDVADERARQDAKWGVQSWPSGTTAEYGYVRDAYREACDAAMQTGMVTWHDITLEEVFEALSEEDPEKLEAELIQAAAVLVAWIEDLRRKRS